MKLRQIEFVVGVVQNGLVRGAGIFWDPAQLVNTSPGFFQEGDLVSVRHVPLQQMANIYLYRTAVAGLPIQNTMETTLDLGNQSIINAARVTAAELAVARVEPNAALSATNIELEANVVIEGPLTVSGNLSTTGDVTAGGVANTGTLTVTNQAGIGSLDVAGTARVDTLQATISFDAGAMFADDVVAADVVADQITTGGCTGC